MNQFPAEFSDLLSPLGRKILDGDRSFVPRDLNNNENHFFVLEGGLDFDKSLSCISILERDFEDELGTICAKLDPEWIEGMTRNFGEVLGKTMNVNSVILRDPNTKLFQRAEQNGLLSLFRSESLLQFAQKATGFRLEGGWGSQIICYKHGHYVGPHNDNMPELGWAKDGYVDVQFMFANEWCDHQWFVHEQDDLLSEIWNIALNGAISVLKQPFWHYTTPLVGKKGKEALARRWLLGQVFRIVDRNNTITILNDTKIDALVKDSEADNITEIPQSSYILEDKQRLAHSLLWKWQRRYYEENGLTAWRTHSVPAGVTTSPLLAEAYAKVVLGLIRDINFNITGQKKAWDGRSDPNQPIFIFELGAGSGRLAYLFLKQIDRLYGEFMMDAPNIRYIMTDFNEATIDAWLSLPSLQPYFASGQLDCAVYDTDVKQSLKLRRSEQEITISSIHNPIVLIANYFFDSIAQDVFKLNEQQLHQGLVTIKTTESLANDPEDPAHLIHAEINYTYQKITTPKYYDSEWDHVLSKYTDEIKDSTFLFPIAALNSIKEFSLLSQQRLLVIAADKGYFTQDDLQNQGNPPLSIHGSFSYMVNFHAIGSYVENHQGFWEYGSEADSSLGVVAFFIGTTDTSVPETLRAFRETVSRFSPIDVYRMLKSIKLDTVETDIEDLLAILRLTGFDPHVVYRLASAFRTRVREISLYATKRIKDSLIKGWNNHYPYGEEIDVAFEIATILQLMNFHAEASIFYQHSIAEHGSHFTSLYNMGLCEYDMGELKDALRCFEEAIVLNPDYNPAIQFRDQVKKELA